MSGDLAELVDLALAAPMCLSGGADGADLQFGMVAGSVGHDVVHWSFQGARTQAPDIEVVRLSQDHLDQADPFLERANLTLDRRLNKSKPWMMNLLRRNWYQVKDSQACYAVSTIKDGQVQGGTSWATQMFIDQHDGASCPCFVFDQARGRWFVWSSVRRETSVVDDPLIEVTLAWKGCWSPIESPPRPTGVYAGIGTRQLLPNGKQAIRDLLGYVKPH